HRYQKFTGQTPPKVAPSVADTRSEVKRKRRQKKREKEKRKMAATRKAEGVKYLGHRDNGAAFVVRQELGGPATPLPLRLDLAAHAEAFAWPQLSPGASQLAVALLSDAAGVEAITLADKFYLKFILHFGPAKFEVGRDNIKAWVEKHLARG